MKEKLTISEMANLRGLTTDTLRHYDRIGLFKPHHVDPHSGYRYYSIFQYEVLGTIKELRQIGMNTDDIKRYLNQRNIQRSYDILREKHAELVAKLNELTKLEENIREKIAYLDEVEQEGNIPEVVVRVIGKRKIITLMDKINSNLELCYGVLRLENLLTEKAPILASNRLGVLIEQADLLGNRFEEPSTIFVVAKPRTNVHNRYIKIIPGGSFACLRYHGELWNRAESLAKLTGHIREQGYGITGDAVQIMQVDITITDNPNEVMFEIQVPISKDQ